MDTSSIFEDFYDDLDYSEPESDESGVGPDSNFLGPESDSEDEPERPPSEPDRSGDHTQEQPPLIPEGLHARKIYNILRYMDGQRISLANLLDGISWGDEECTQNAQLRVDRPQFLNSPELPGILKRWWRPPRSRAQNRKRPKEARVAMEHFAFQCTQQILEEEMELLLKIFKSPAGDDIKEEQLTGISFPKMVEQVTKTAPNLHMVEIQTVITFYISISKHATCDETGVRGNPLSKYDKMVVLMGDNDNRLWDVFESKAQQGQMPGVGSGEPGKYQKLARSESQKARSPKKSPVNTILIVIAMFSYSRSHHRSRLQKLFAIYFKFRGLSAKGFDTLHAIGLTMSNKWTGNAVARTSAQSMATRIDKGTSHGSGTAATVYVKRSAKPLPSTINQDFQEMRQVGMANPLDAFDIFQLSELADNRRYPHIIHLILRYLLDAPDFNSATYTGRDHQLLQPPSPIRQLPVGKEHITLQYLLGTVNMPEASYEDNSNLVREWLRQLGLDSPEQQKKLGLEQVMTWVGDQLTVDRLRNLSRFRAEDDNSFERLDWLIVPSGWLHIQMAFANSVHKQHLGTAKGRGLTAAFDILKRRGLQSSQTEEAQVREVWLQVGKTTDLKELRKKNPVELYAMAGEIFSFHASSHALADLRRRSVTDDIKLQSMMFLRNVIPFILLRAAVRSGDIGFMEDMIPLLLYRFVGGKNSNYAIEMLELLQSLHREWPPELADFVRENGWVINNTGGSKNHMPVDEAQEMNIKDIKVTYRSEGPKIDWDYLKKLHPAIHVTRAVNAHMETEFKTRVRGSKHTVPKKELDIQELQKWYRASEVHALKPNRIVKENAKKQSPDVPKDFLGKGSNGIQMGKTMNNWVDSRTIGRSYTQDWNMVSDSDSEKKLVEITVSGIVEADKRDGTAQIAVGNVKDESHNMARQAAMMHPLFVGCETAMGALECDEAACMRLTGSNTSDEHPSWTELWAASASMGSSTEIKINK
ncbi:hypothetical protein C8R45DRAFT_1135396 [Mycena sanguinolenta]|nr:hypothetical protein C8R45DRAFT_1135396 [Mycena sanguinolenta]